MIYFMNFFTLQQRHPLHCVYHLCRSDRHTRRIQQKSGGFQVFPNCFLVSLAISSVGSLEQEAFQVLNWINFFSEICQAFSGSVQPSWNLPNLLRTLSSILRLCQSFSDSANPSQNSVKYSQARYNLLALFQTFSDSVKPSQTLFSLLQTLSSFLRTLSSLIINLSSLLRHCQDSS